MQLLQSKVNTKTLEIYWFQYDACCAADLLVRDYDIHTRSCRLFDPDSTELK